MQSSGDTDSQNSWPPYQIEGFQGLGKYVYFIYFIYLRFIYEKGKRFSKRLLAGTTSWANCFLFQHLKHIKLWSLRNPSGVSVGCAELVVLMRPTNTRRNCSFPFISARTESHPNHSVCVSLIGLSVTFVYCADTHRTNNCTQAWLIVVLVTAGTHTLSPLTLQLFNLWPWNEH